MFVWTKKYQKKCSNYTIGITISTYESRKKKQILEKRFMFSIQAFGALIKSINVYPIYFISVHRGQWLKYSRIFFSLQRTLGIWFLFHSFFHMIVNSQYGATSIIIDHVSFPMYDVSCNKSTKLNWPIKNLIDSNWLPFRAGK